MCVISAVGAYVVKHNVASVSLAIASVMAEASFAFCGSIHKRNFSEICTCSPFIAKVFTCPIFQFYKGSVRSFFTLAFRLNKCWEA